VICRHDSREGGERYDLQIACVKARTLVTVEEQWIPPSCISALRAPSSEVVGSMDRAALLKLWNFEDTPACDEGMMLAAAFLVSCGVDKLGVAEPSDRVTDMNGR
jgi:hypothetical protein